jgi:hypothetical protein
MRNKQVGSRGKWESKCKRRDMVNSQRSYTRSKQLKFHIEKELESNENLRSGLSSFSKPPSAPTLKDPPLPFKLSITKHQPWQPKPKTVHPSNPHKLKQTCSICSSILPITSQPNQRLE